MPRASFLSWCHLRPSDTHLPLSHCTGTHCAPMTRICPLVTSLAALQAAFWLSCTASSLAVQRHALSLALVALHAVATHDVVVCAGTHIRHTLVTALVTFRIASPPNTATGAGVHSRHAHHTVTNNNEQYSDGSVTAPSFNTMPLCCI